MSSQTKNTGILNNNNDNNNNNKCFHNLLLPAHIVPISLWPSEEKNLINYIVINY